MGKRVRTARPRRVMAAALTSLVALSAAAGVAAAGAPELISVPISVKLPLLGDLSSSSSSPPAPPVGSDGAGADANLTGPDERDEAMGLAGLSIPGSATASSSGSDTAQPWLAAAAVVGFGMVVSVGGAMAVVQTRRRSRRRSSADALAVPPAPAVPPVAPAPGIAPTFTETRELSPDGHPGAAGIMILGHRAASRGRFDEAAAWFDAALTIEPHLAVAHVCKGLSLVGLDNLLDARMEFRAAAEIDPTDALARLHLARSCAALGLDVEALDAVRAYLRLRPDAVRQVDADATFAALHDHPRFLMAVGRL